MAAVDDDLMKEDETMGTVDDQTIIGEMDQDGMIDVDRLYSAKIRINKFPPTAAAAAPSFEKRSQMAGPVTDVNEAYVS